MNFSLLLNGLANEVSLMYLYARKLSGVQSKKQPITARPAPQDPLQRSVIAADKTSPTPKLRVGTYWANDFSKGCKDDDRLKYSDDLARGFVRAMAAQGHQWAVDHDSSHASPTDWLSYPDKRGTPYDNSERRKVLTAPTLPIS